MDPSIPVAAVNRGYTARSLPKDSLMAPFRPVFHALAFALAALVLAGCGNKGPLVKPPPAPAAPAAVTQPASH
jgi:predicted small lipoprotein YifL